MKLSISMTRREFLWGWGYLLFSMFLFPTLLTVVSSLLAKPLTETLANILYFIINFLCVAAIFRRFLWSSLKAAANRPWRCLLFAAIGFAVYTLALLLLARITARIDPNFSNVNDDAILDMAQEHTGLMVFCTVFLVPITEETLYRGLLFQGLQRKNRALAYLVSVSVFAWIHVMGYVGQFDWRTLLLCFVQYLPAGIILALAYEKTDTIITPILIHIAVNQIGMSAMR